MLTKDYYDIIVVGGGIVGICIAWEAASRGLSVGLVERGDFAQGASSNCFKMVHGGIRYLQHADLPGLRESSSERRAFLRIAPHLVEPIPIAVPTYGHGRRGKEALLAALWAYNVLTVSRNRGIDDPVKRIPKGHALSREECLERFPHLPADGLTGAATFYDGHMYSPARLALSFLRSALAHGAEASNYTAVHRLLTKDNRVIGVEVERQRDRRHVIYGNIIANATGAWSEPLLHRSGIGKARPSQVFSRDTAFVIRRRLVAQALAVQGMTQNPDSKFSRGKRHLLVVPWRERTLLGVWHSVHHGPPDDVQLTQEELHAFLDEFNATYPVEPPLAVQDIELINYGLTLFGDRQRDDANLGYAKRSLIFDHHQTDGVEGLVTVLGVKYTTARAVAQETIDLVSKKIGGRTSRSQTASTPIWGGAIEDFEAFIRHGMERRPSSVSPESMHGLLRNHGSEHQRVLQYVKDTPELGWSLGGSSTLAAEILYAIREEMAQYLSDVVFRRTDLGGAGHPGEAALHECAALMARELGWSDDVREAELAEVMDRFSAPTPAHSLDPALS